ncbi:hypothetical protein J5N97_014337 [Dioscorea zingiberensis]|uniref:Uncharacterized protein n=1 Tax=Dioscorea zingiberensis TaxID=325984 RepID=A0A9D5CUX2_9LILI|nr:hypothetical protein J5N97_014337 [Dioscorea zingiberensis]
MAILTSSTLAFLPNTNTSISHSSSSSSFATILPFHPRTSRCFKPLLASSTPEGGSPAEPEPSEAPDPVKLAFSKAEAYKKTKASTPIPKPNPAPGSPAQPKGSTDPDPEVPDSVRLAMEKAKEYKKNKAAASASASGSGVDVPVEKPKPRDFEFIVGDASKFQGTTLQKLNIEEKEEDMSNLYKPKVSTWGVFPRPGNISKTFGGGRVIRPGEQLETAEDKAVKEKRTKELISAYREKMGLKIDPQTKLECEKALREGDILMDSGKLQEAMPYYEQVMKAVIFQSELHGLAALQWSICQDSLRRPKEARTMYEKLQSHPNAQVSKKARQFVFSFQAMEMMKVTSSPVSRKTGFENYFDAFVEDRTNYSPSEEEKNEVALMSEGLPYIMFLLSPVLLVFLAAVRKSFQF